MPVRTYEENEFPRTTKILPNTMKHIFISYGMSETESKEATLKNVYENAASGYGSIRDTYIQANKINPGIRYVDVKEYLDKQQHRQTRFKYKGSNSFVSPHALFEIEVDLVYLTFKAEENGGFRYGFVGIDNFTKYAWVVPMITKKTS